LVLSGKKQQNVHNVKTADDLKTVGTALMRAFWASVRHDWVGRQGVRWGSTRRIGIGGRKVNHRLSPTDLKRAAPRKRIWSGRRCDRSEGGGKVMGRNAQNRNSFVWGRKRTMSKVGEKEGGDRGFRPLRQNHSPDFYTSAGVYGKGETDQDQRVKRLRNFRSQGARKEKVIKRLLECPSIGGSRLGGLQVIEDHGQEHVGNEGSNVGWIVTWGAEFFAGLLN